jgi:hypothetical protein
LQSTNKSLKSDKVTLEKKLAEANKKVKLLTNQLEAMSQRGAPRAMREDGGYNRSELPHLGANNSQFGANQIDMVEEAEMSTLSEVIKNNPKKAKETIIMYKQEINYLKTKLLKMQDGQNVDRNSLQN